jgi:hypothetical protein
MYADPYTRQCVSKCDPVTGLFGDGNIAIPACVSVCKTGSYSDPYTQTCVASCRTSTPRMWAFDNGDTTTPVRQCVYGCPYPYVADNTTGKCNLVCNNATIPYLDKGVKQCVAKCSSPVYQYSYMPLGQTTGGSCVTFCPLVSSVRYYALLSNNSCVRVCPSGLYGSATNNTCMGICSLANHEYADDTNNLCVTECTHNASYFSYANEFTRACVTVCPASKGLVGDQLIWKCVARCSSLTQYADLNAGYCVSLCPSGYFADNSTQTCVSNCSQYTLMYGDTVNRVCVTVCPTSTLYTDELQRLCVVATSCSPSFFAYNTSGSCIAKCPISPDYYGDPITQIC